MNGRAIIVALVLASVVSSFQPGSRFPYQWLITTFVVLALLFHIKPGLLGKLNKPKEDEPTDNDSE
jgi:hypothetical protein